MGWLGKIASGLGLLVVCLLVFDIPAAYVFSRGWSPWLALAVGLVTFPVLPLVWHGLGERSRKKKLAAAKAPAKPPMTKGWERLLLRGGAIGGAVIATLIAVDREGTWNAFRHHALWFVPDSSEPLVADSRMLRLVPSNANAVLWVRANDDARAELEPTFGADTEFLRASELVFAGGATDMLVAESGEFEIVKTYAELFDDFPSLRPPMLTEKPVPLAGGGRYWATPDWTASVSKGTPGPLFALIPRAPASAFAVAVAVPGDGPAEEMFEKSGATAAVVYVHVTDGKLALVGELDFANEAQRDKAAAEARRALDEITGQVRDCIVVAQARTSITSRGMTLRFEASMPVTRIRDAMTCVDKKD